MPALNGTSSTRSKMTIFVIYTSGSVTPTYHGSISIFTTNAVTGFTEAGVEAIDALTRKLRAEFPDLSRTIATSQLNKVLREKILSLWGREGAPETPTD